MKQLFKRARKKKKRKNKKNIFVRLLNTFNTIPEKPKDQV